MRSGKCVSKAAVSFPQGLGLAPGDDGGVCVPNAAMIISMTVALRKIAHEKLASVADGLRTDSLGITDREQLASQLGLIAGGANADRVLGLARGPGQRTWPTVQALHRRDELLREIASRYFAGMTVTEQARALSVALLRYREGPWRRERAAERAPRHPLHALLWQTLRSTDRALGERMIKIILQK